MNDMQPRIRIPRKAKKPLVRIAGAILGTVIGYGTAQHLNKHDRLEAKNINASVQKFQTREKNSHTMRELLDLEENRLLEQTQRNFGVEDIKDFEEIESMADYINKEIEALAGITGTSEIELKVSPFTGNFYVSKKIPGKAALQLRQSLKELNAAIEQKPNVKNRLMLIAGIESHQKGIQTFNAEIDKIESEQSNIKEKQNRLNRLSEQIRKRLNNYGVSGAAAGILTALLLSKLIRRIRSGRRLRRMKNKQKK